MNLPTKAAQMQEFSVQFHNIYNFYVKTYACPMTWIVQFFLSEYSKKIAGLDAYIVHLIFSLQFI